MMTTALKGKTVAEAEDVFQRFQRMVTADQGDGDAGQALGKLAIFAGVREFPSRIKCATLAWHAVRAALGAAPEPVSTE
jgi:nitrogen fixation NifU-like protein